jgi:hypothetical protein
MIHNMGRSVIGAGKVRFFYGIAETGLTSRSGRFKCNEQWN